VRAASGRATISVPLTALHRFIGCSCPFFSLAIILPSIILPSIILQIRLIPLPFILLPSAEIFFCPKIFQSEWVFLRSFPFAYLACFAVYESVIHFFSASTLPPFNASSD
jgi:hypothetical protein